MLRLPLLPLDSTSDLSTRQQLVHNERSCITLDSTLGETFIFGASLVICPNTCTARNSSTGMNTFRLPGVMQRSMTSERRSGDYKNIRGAYRYDGGYILLSVESMTRAGQYLRDNSRCPWANEIRVHSRSKNKRI